MRALRQLGRKVVGGRPQMLRESAMIYHAGPALIGKRIVIDPGHGSNDAGWVVTDEPARTGTRPRSPSTWRPASRAGSPPSAYAPT